MAPRAFWTGHLRLSMVNIPVKLYPATTAERAFLAATGAGCHVPVAAYARISGEGRIELSAQLFTEDGTDMVQGTHSGSDPSGVGIELARLLRDELRLGGNDSAPPATPDGPRG